MKHKVYRATWKTTLNFLPNTLQVKAKIYIELSSEPVSYCSHKENSESNDKMHSFCYQHAELEPKWIDNKK